ncbi:MAG: nucleotidyl transferase AbiEii/AbiGii toxin family protein [Flavobacteriales bacterium]|nr:nucleotidyl transferase AbiEii/AbiGii toxin family protein [Flavobacteriales bacterium]
MRLEALDQFALVGGTALALRYGHRLSVDLDLFGHELQHEAMVEALRSEFGASFSYEPPAQKSIGVFCFIDGIKVDIVRYPHPRIAEVTTVGDVRMYADDDIAAMKVQAILGRGRKKDFWDLAELIRHRTLASVIDCHARKYPNQMLAISIPNALVYYADAEESEVPVSLKQQTWEGVKQVVRNAVEEFLR